MKPTRKQTKALLLSAACVLCLLAFAAQARAGTTNVLQWSFTNTSGPTTVPIADTSGFTPANSALDLVDDDGAPTNSADIPTNTQFCTGLASIDFTGVTTGLSTTNSEGVGSGQGIVTAAQIYAAGGLTMEVWVKNPSVGTTAPGIALNMAGMYVLGVSSTGNVGFFHGDNSDDLTWTTTPVDSSQWMHLAVVLAKPNPTAFTYSNISSYINGNLIYSGSYTLPFFLGRAVSVGNHQYANFGDYEGLVYEPRITLGALTPAQFTIPPPSVYVVVTQDPTNAFVKAGESATFSVSATVFGAPPSSLTYQWLENGSPIQDATNASYTAAAAALSDNLSIFSCGVSAVGDLSTNISETATLYVYGQQGTLLDYAFALTNGSVADNGSVVTNDASPGMYDGFILTGDGGAYTNDLPSSNLLQNVSGVGSLDLASGALSTDPTGPTVGGGILDFEDIAGNGGLTLETWVKGGSGGGMILNVADTYFLAATPSGFQFGFDASSLTVNADATKWHHLAGIISGASVSGGSLQGDLSLYLDGVLQGTISGAATSNDRQRATAVGNDSLVNSLGVDSPFTGEVFEPRVTLGALAPSQFTTKLQPAGVSVTQQPQSEFITTNGLLNFTVAASVTGDTMSDLRYQWLSNGVAIAGATNSAYSPGMLPGGTEINYSCELTLASFSSVSAVSTLATGGVASQSGTIIQYGFGFTNDSVADDGGFVTNQANPGVYDGFVLTSDGGAYTNDVPQASLLQYTTGIGSLDLADGGSISTDPTGGTSGEGVLNYVDILGNGGLTLETWFKGGAEPNIGLLVTVAGAYNLEADQTTNTVGFTDGFTSTGVEATVDFTQWHHAAGVLSDPSLAGNGNLMGNLSLYVDGVLVGTYSNAVFGADLGRGMCVGNHPLVNSLNIANPWNGIVFEPRVTLGALNPAQFTIVPPPVLSIALNGGDAVVSWIHGGTLYSADQLTGPWVSVTNAVSPYTNALSAAQSRFFRVQR